MSQNLLTVRTDSGRLKAVSEAIEDFTNSHKIPVDYKPFSPDGLRGDGEVDIVTTEAEASALSEKHGHQVRVEPVDGELVYVLVSEADYTPTQHVGTLRGVYLDTTLNKLEHRLFAQQGTTTVASTTAAPGAGLDTRDICMVTWCAVTWSCIYYDPNCHGCVVFWCT